MRSEAMLFSVFGWTCDFGGRTLKLQWQWYVHAVICNYLRWDQCQIFVWTCRISDNLSKDSSPVCICIGPPSIHPTQSSFSKDQVTYSNQQGLGLIPAAMEGEASAHFFPQQRRVSRGQLLELEDCWSKVRSIRIVIMVVWNMFMFTNIWTGWLIDNFLFFLTSTNHVIMIGAVRLI